MKFIYNREDIWTHLCRVISIEKIEKSIETLAEKDKLVCAFGTGNIGTGIGMEYVNIFGRTIDFFCDNNSQKWGTEIIDGIKCISVEELIAKKNDVVCFVLLGLFDITEVCEQLVRLGISAIIPYSQETMCYFQKNHFYSFDIKRNVKMPLVENKEKTVTSIPERGSAAERIAVYTCITGGYDIVRDPEYVSENCDYFLITDQKMEYSGMYTCLNINDFLPQDIKDNRRKNRYCKMNPHKIFPQYNYSVYLDGKIQITGNILPFFKEIGSSGIAAFRSIYTNDIYEEGIMCANKKLDKLEVMMNQIGEYWEEGMPCDTGAIEAAVLVRRHMDKNCIEIMEAWWEEVKTKSERDQISLPYVLWKRGFGIEDVGELDPEYYRNGTLKVLKHKVPREIDRA